MHVLRARDKAISLDRPAIMGVLNINEDSFSDPGPRTETSVIEQALRLVDDGASIIDIGAQSSITRRRAMPPETEIEAVVPVVRKLVAELPQVVVSVDTFKPDVANAALSAGAHIINDVSGLRDVNIAAQCARHNAGLVIMHTSVPPLVRMQQRDLYIDVCADVADFISRRISQAVSQGVKPHSIIVDPGPDFSKTPYQTVQLLRGLSGLVLLGHPILLAVSRKDFIGALIKRSPQKRLAGTLGAIAALRDVPGQILRVHNVRETVEMLTVFDALTGELQTSPALRLDEELRHNVAPSQNLT